MYIPLAGTRWGYRNRHAAITPPVRSSCGGWHQNLGTLPTTGKTQRASSWQPWIGWFRGRTLSRHPLQWSPWRWSSAESSKGFKYSPCISEDAFSFIFSCAVINTFFIATDDNAVFHLQCSAQKKSIQNCFLVRPLLVIETHPSSAETQSPTKPICCGQVEIRGGDRSTPISPRHLSALQGDIS